MKTTVRARLYWPLVILVLVSIAGVIAISIFSCRYADALAENTSTVASVDTLLSAGIGMMGILIAVWTALTISNVISRKDVDELNHDIEAAKKNMTAIDAYIEKDIHIQAELFYVETSRNYWDPLLRHLIQSFPTAEKLDNVANLFSDLAIVELKYSQVKIRHQDAYAYDENLISIADEGLRKIKSIKKERGKALPQYAKNYLNYRKCGFNFFAGYCEKNKEFCVKRFVKAAQGYQKLADAFSVSLKKESTHREVNVAERKCHLANSIGESYSKIVQFYCDASQSEKINFPYSGEINKYADNAKFFCEMASDINAGLDAHTLSVFFRNLGCAYERADRLSQTPYQKNFIKIINSYKNSISCALAESASIPSTIKLAYVAFLSYLCNYLYETRNETCTETSQDRASLSLELYKYARDALDYFPWSLEFVILCELAGRLRNRFFPGSVSQSEIESYADIRKQVLKKEYIGNRVCMFVENIEKLISEEEPCSIHTQANL